MVGWRGSVDGMNQAARFHWRTMDDAPRDGSTFVHLGFVTWCGGPSRPLNLEPELSLLQRTHIAAMDWNGCDARGLPCTFAPGEGRPGGGFWSEARYQHSMSGDAAQHGHWLWLDEFSAAVDSLPSWRSATVGVGPLVFVRPTDPAVRYDFSHDVLDAEVIWPSRGGWATVHTLGDAACHPGYLDGDNVTGRAFRWCTIEDFIPRAVIEQYQERERRVAAFMAEHASLDASAH